MKKSVFFIIIIICLSICPCMAFAATLNVPGTYATIQAAINAASAGDTVLVEAGTYNEAINFNGKAITVKSSAGAASTIINVNWSGFVSVVTFNHGDGPNSVLEGFTIKHTQPNPPNYDAYGEGIYISSSSSPTITECTISDNCVAVGAIYISNLSSPTITKCTISDNSAVVGGIYIESSSAKITECTITRNHGGIYCSSSSPNINKCTIKDNSVTEAGAGILSDAGSSPKITNCLITGNSAYQGAGIYCSNSISALPTITHCTVTGNTAGSNGGGIFCSSNTTIINSIFWGNSAPSDPEVFHPSGSPTIAYSDVQGGWMGIGNINTNPLFVGAGDYHIQEKSPCKEAGTNAGIVDDIDGEYRPYDSGYDMGSDEYAPPGGGCDCLASHGGNWSGAVSSMAMCLMPVGSVLSMKRRLAKKRKKQSRM